MMKIDQIIRQRRSIRQYTTKMVDDEDIQKVLTAGIWAPSGLNNQPWKFKLIKDGAQKSGLAKFTKYSKVIENAPVVICVFLDGAATYNREKDIMAIGACIQNMLLQAYSLGLGTCWLGEILNKKKDVARFLNLDEDLELMAAVTLGYPDEDITEGCRKIVKNLKIKS